MDLSINKKVSRSHGDNIALLKKYAGKGPSPWRDVKRRWKSLAQQGVEGCAQRSPAWFKRRRGKFTGSKWSNFFFMDGEEDYHLLRGRTFGTLDEAGKRVFAPGEVFDAISIKRMAYGTKFEDNAAADCLLRLPNCIGNETTILEHPTIAYLASSPDGTIDIHDPVTKTYDTVAFEIKCPSAKLDKRSGKLKYKSCTSPIWYYLPQVFMEMIATGTKGAIFQVWNAERHRVWYIPWNQEYYDCMIQLVAAFKDQTVTYSEFQHMKRFIKDFSIVLCKNCVALHPRGGFVSMFTDGSFNLA